MNDIHNVTDNKGTFSDFKMLNINNLDFNAEQITKRKWHTIYYVTGGNGLLQIDFDEHIALKNKIFLIDKYKIASWEKQNKIEGLAVQFTDAFYNLIYTGNPIIKSDQTLLGDFPPFIKIEQAEESEWSHIIDVISTEYNNLNENSKEVICLCLKILIMLYRRKAFIKGRFMITDRKKQLLNEFRKLINARYQELKTPGEYAQKLSISPNYLNAICKEIFNKTVSELIQERIILEAKRLLVNTGLNVSEISYKLGFKDNSYFGRYFKKAVGLPPERYRKVYYRYYHI
ncbi:MAG: helix-turn-helix domain-containing protein [Bacteroidales bacterium]|nr:helix-turn-helix domain-containing protein [Bacteroidales bacterium]